MAPDGNGGVYMALRSSGALADMAAHGVEAVDCYCVDNALVRLGDPLFVGYCHERGIECGERAAQGYCAGGGAWQCGRWCGAWVMVAGWWQTPARQATDGKVACGSGNRTSLYHQAIRAVRRVSLPGPCPPPPPLPPTQPPQPPKTLTTPTHPHTTPAQRRWLPAVGARVVAKAYPEEKVGVFARRGGALEVVEYSGEAWGWPRHRAGLAGELRASCTPSALLRGQREVGCEVRMLASAVSLPASLCGCCCLACCSC